MTATVNTGNHGAAAPLHAASDEADLAAYAEFDAERRFPDVARVSAREPVECVSGAILTLKGVTKRYAGAAGVSEVLGGIDLEGVARDNGPGASSSPQLSLCRQGGWTDLIPAPS